MRREGGRAASSRATATLPPSAYRLEWRAMGDDGHVMSGAVRFAVNATR
ncbi:copper resistance protein CopC [Roseomonas chloroacetimidivorans]